MVASKNLDGIDFAGGICMTVVGANDDVIVSGVFQDVRKVVVGLRGYVDSKFLAWVSWDPWFQTGEWLL